MMLADKHCPKCDEVLNIDARACGNCGWRKAGKVMTITADTLRCAWRAGCTERGCISDSTNGAGPWYCSPHWWLLKGQSVSAGGAHETYRERYCREHGIVFELPKAGNASIPQRFLTREPGQDDEERIA